jgi:hypothetical protein
MTFFCAGLIFKTNSSVSFTSSSHLYAIRKGSTVAGVARGRAHEAIVPHSRSKCSFPRTVQFIIKVIFSALP